jgi:hypothetical protein
MPDNVGYTPGSGAIIAADDIGGALHQRVKVVVGADGVNDGDVSLANPMPVQGVGELVEQLAAIRFLLQSLSRTVGQAMPDAFGRLLVNVATGSVAVSALPTLAAVTTVTTVNTVTTVTTVGTVTNQTNIGGLPATEQIPSLMRMGADSLRRNIVVT